MTRQLPVWLARGVLIVIVVAVVLAGHWLIPASIGLIPRIFALSLLVIVALWLISRLTRRTIERS
ncbi:MAG: hypothetical protein WCK20_01415 [Thermoleophilia bacterium]|jgi:hypothetical protein